MADPRLRAAGWGKRRERPPPNTMRPSFENKPSMMRRLYQNVTIQGWIFFSLRKVMETSVNELPIMKTMKTLLTLCSVVAMASQAQATTLLTETFTYPDGDLLGNGDWQIKSGFDRPIQVTGGTITLVQQGSSGEDLFVGFPAQNSLVLTATFDFSVTADNKVGGGDYEYFIHFGGSPLRTSLLYIVPSGTPAGDFSVGITTKRDFPEAPTAETMLAADLFFNTPYSASISFDFSTGLASASVAGFDPITSTTVRQGAFISEIELRQSNSSSGERVTLDNLIITVVPEPSSLVLLSGSLGLLAFSRRRR